LAFNPAGDLPVLVDGDVALTDAAAILVHLCKHHDSTGLWRSDGPGVQRWIDFAAGPLAAVSEARKVTLFGAAGDRDALVRDARAVLRLIEDHLTERSLLGESFMAGKAPTLADVAIFAPIAISHDCGIGHEDYPAINLWQRRMRALPGFITMPGIPDYF
jgi:glutathione S-transferase